MGNQTEQPPFNDEKDFGDNLTDILNDLLNEKLKKFLEFCVQTHQAKPIQQIIDIINNNHFNEE